MMNISKIISKDTRWDRIRKRHMNSLSVKTETVKKFFAMDYIAKNKLKVLSLDDRSKRRLDPVLVMDLRHEMVPKKPKRKTPFCSEKDISLDKTKAHNRSVEDHYIENELNKFKSDLEKSRKKVSIRPKLCLNLTNQALYTSLENCNGHTLDFYNTIQTALCGQKPDNFTCAPNNENNTIILQNADRIERNVRFEDSVEIINYSIDISICSNTSSDVDSVISEFVEDVVNEIEFETQMEMVGKSFDSLQKSEPTDSNYVCSQAKLASNSDPLPPILSEDLLKVTKISQETRNQSHSEQLLDEETSSSQISGSESPEQFDIITELFKSKMPSNEIVLRKYFFKWIHYTTIEKIEKQNLNCRNNRIHKINSFLDKIRHEKKHPVKNEFETKTENRGNSVVLAKKYQNKIKIQQDIINLQKIKLERQERLIMELKISKLTDEAKQAKEMVKQELKTVIKTGDIKNRTKAKCLQLVGNLRDENEDEFARLQGKSLLMPKFLINMQERALERSIKHEQARERRLKLDAEREAAKIAAEEAKRFEDEEAKKARIEVLKEKRRQEKLAKIIKERERIRCIENNKKCQEFCRRRLLRSVGMEGFKRLLKMKRKNHKKAEVHKKLVLKKKVLKYWKIYTDAVWECKKNLANQLYIKIVKRTAFAAWISFYSMEKSKFLVAVDWYELKLSEIVFQQWMGQMKLQKIVEDTKITQAVSHYNWNMRWKVLDHWRRLPQVLKIEKETEERRQRWRMKIWELLPDYKPNRDEKY